MLRIVILTLIGAAVFVGACADSRGRVGGVDRTTVLGSGGEKLTLVKPKNVAIRRGEAESVVVRLRRHHFSDEVKITVSQLPRGVNAVDVPRATNADRVELLLRADEDAALVRGHQVMVTAHGPDGISATETLEISVRERS